MIIESEIRTYKFENGYVYRIIHENGVKYAEKTCFSEQGEVLLQSILNSSCMSKLSDKEIIEALTICDVLRDVKITSEEYYCYVLDDINMLSFELNAVSCSQEFSKIAVYCGKPISCKRKKIAIDDTKSIQKFALNEVLRYRNKFLRGNTSHSMQKSQFRQRVAPSPFDNRDYF